MSQATDAEREAMLARKARERRIGDLFSLLGSPRERAEWAALIEDRLAALEKVATRPTPNKPGKKP